MAVAAGRYVILGLKSDGTVVAAGDLDQHDYLDWNNICVPDTFMINNDK